MREKGLVVKGIRHAFGEKKVLEGVNFNLKQGEIFVVIGPSGAGKTTLLKILAGLLPPTSGQVFLNGNPVDKPRGEIGLIFQDFNLWPHKTVLENLTEALVQVKKRPLFEARRQARKMLARIELLDKAEEFPDNLSGGQKQRVAIARALLMKPELILLDEVTSALDPVLTRSVMNLIKELAEDGVSMIVVSHEMDFVKEIAHKIIFLDEGKVVEAGAPMELFFNPQEKRTKDFLALGFQG